MREVLMAAEMVGKRVNLMVVMKELKLVVQMVPETVGN